MGNVSSGQTKTVEVRKISQNYPLISFKNSADNADFSQ